MEHAANSCLTDTHSFGQSLLTDASGGVHADDRQLLLFGETRLPAEPLVPTFSPPVSHILRMGAKEEVTRVLAGWVVAPMADMQGPRAFAMVKFPSVSMSEDRSSLSGRKESAVPKPAVPLPLRLFRTEPKPTLVVSSSSNVDPVALFDGEPMLGHHSMLQGLGL